MNYITSPIKSFANKKYFLFDLDGTLVDTRELVYHCFDVLLTKFFNMHIEREDVFKYIGLPYRVQLEKYLGKLEDEQFNELCSWHKNHQASIAHDYIKLCKGAEELLNFLAQKEKKMAVVTSRLIESSADYLKFLNIYHYFETIVTPAQTKKGKPDAEPVLYALNFFNATASEAIFIGDSVFDIEAGSGAKVDTIYTNWDRAAFPPSSAKPTYAVDDLRQIIWED